MLQFSFKGTNSGSMGVYLIEPLKLSAAERSVDTVQIPGRDGELTIDNGCYKSFDCDLNCYIDDPAKLPAALAWLDGSGALVADTSAPLYCYRARVTGNTEAERMLRGMPAHTLTIQMRLEPYRYLTAPGAAITVSQSQTAITNPGTAAAVPLLRVNATGDGTVMIGNNTMILSNVQGYIMLDCEAMIAYKGVNGSATDPLLLLGAHVTGEWMRIQPGLNYITFTGDITSVEVTPRWRWL